MTTITESVMKNVYSDPYARRFLLELKARGQDTVDTYKHVLNYSAPQFAEALKALESCALVEHRMPADDPAIPRERRITRHHIALTALGRVYADAWKEWEAMFVDLARENRLPVEFVNSEIE